MGNFYNRVGYVEIVNPDGKVYRYGGESGAPLDFKFSVRRPLGCSKVRAHISILGLSIETINFLTSVEDVSTVQKQKKTVRVYAGYQDTGASLIFSGIITYARPTKPPNMWMEIDATSAFDGGNEGVSYSINITDGNTLTFHQICKRVAADMGVRLAFQAREFASKKITKFCAKGTKRDVISALTTLADVRVYVDSESTEDTLWIKPRRPSASDSVVETINADSGLISVSEINFYGVTIVRFLDVGIERCDWIKLSSDILKVASKGRYYVYEVEHRGHLRGEEWVTVIRAMSEKEALKNG